MQNDFRHWLLNSSLSLVQSNDQLHWHHMDRCHAETGLWLETEEIFQSWLQPDSRICKIWIKGRIGSGKSVLCASAIQRLRERRPDCMCIFQYFSFEYFSFEERRISDVQVYQCLAEQMVTGMFQKGQDLPEEVLVFTQRTMTGIKSDALRELLRILVQQSGPVYMFLDGLDELCDSGPCWAEMSRVLDFAMELAGANENLKIWYSSQERSCIIPKLSGIETIDVTCDRNAMDIGTYLKDSVQSLDVLEDEDEGTRNLLIQELGNKADGCFLWAALMIDALARAHSLNDMQQLVRNSIPRDYEKRYKTKLESIEPSQRGFLS